MIIESAEEQDIGRIKEIKDQVITINGVSKGFAMTGWRLGYIVAPPEVASAIRKMHDFLTVGAPAPLQDAAAVALDALLASCSARAAFLSS